MSFAMPWAFVAGVVAALGVVALHLLSTQRPPVEPLPTARFVPASDVRAVSRTARPTDVPLMLLRVLAALLIGAAFAQPIPDAPGPALRRVVALEWTTALGDPEAARAAAQRLLGEGDALVVYDTAARLVTPEALAALPAPTVRRAALSPMFLAAHDAARQIARGADSLALTVIGAFPVNAWDEATDALRAQWPGRLEPMRVAGIADTAAAPGVTVLSAAADDPLAPAVAALPVARGAHPLRLRVGETTAADTQWLSGAAGGVLLRWPAPSADSLPADGVLAADGASAALVAPLGRGAVPDGRVIARWRDGTPAVTERVVGQGCERTVGIVLPRAGDLTLRSPFQALLAVLLAPCGGARAAGVADSTLARFAGAGAWAAAAPFATEAAASPLTPWLLAAALLALVAEQWWRRRRRPEAA
jgi:hypothetical protein